MPRVMEDSFLQPEKALLPIVFSLLPVTTVFKLVQLWKTLAPMDATRSILAVFKPVQPRKALLPMLFTALPMAAAFSFLQPEKALLPIEVTFLPIFTDCRAVQPMKAFLPMVFTESPMVALASFLWFWNALAATADGTGKCLLSFFRSRWLLGHTPLIPDMLCVPWLSYGRDGFPLGNLLAADGAVGIPGIAWSRGGRFLAVPHSCLGMVVRFRLVPYLNLVGHDNTVGCRAVLLACDPHLQRVGSRLQGFCFVHQRLVLLAGLVEVNLFFCPAVDGEGGNADVPVFGAVVFQRRASKPKGKSRPQGRG